MCADAQDKYGNKRPSWDWYTKFKQMDWDFFIHSFLLFVGVSPESTNNKDYYLDETQPCVSISVHRTLIRIFCLASLRLMVCVRLLSKIKKAEKTISTILVFLFTRLRRACGVYKAKEREWEKRGIGFLCPCTDSGYFTLYLKILHAPMFVCKSIEVMTSLSLCIRQTSKALVWQDANNHIWQNQIVCCAEYLVKLNRI